MKNKFVICHDIENKKYKVAVEKLNFRPAVFGLIFRGDTILLSKLWNGYSFPGGGVMRGELLADALKREVFEETGIKVQPDKVVEVCEDFFISIESRRELHSILIFYLCKNPKGNAYTKNFDKNEKKYMSTAEWVAIKDIPKLKFYNAVNNLRLIKEAYKLHKQ